MKIKNLLIIIFCLVVKSSFSQVTFQKTFGDVYNDFGRQVLALPGGGYAVLGSLNSKVYLIKTDSLGNTVLTKTYSPSSAAFYQQGNLSFQLTRDGGFIIVCNIPGSFSYYYPRICLMKTNSAGTISWTKYFTSPRQTGNYGTWAYEVINTLDSGYAVVGVEAANTDYNAFLLKTDGSGNVQWAKSYGKVGDDAGFSVKQNAIGQYVIAGYSDAAKYGNRDIFLVKTDLAGNMIWYKKFGGPRQDYATHLEITTNNNYILTGVVAGFGTNFNGDDMFLLKTDSAGTALWKKIYSGPASQAGTSVKQTADAGFVATGYTASYGAGQKDVYLVKTDSSGNVQWSRTFGGIVNDEGIDVIVKNDGYVITGLTENFSKGLSDVYLIKTDNAGNSTCKQKNISPVVTIPALIQDTGCVVSSGYLTSTASVTAASEDTTSYNVCVCRPPHAEFYWSALHNCAYFDNYSTWANSWHWNFGDGQTDTIQYPNHCYTGGDYKVCLTVTNECGTNTFCDSLLDIHVGVNEISENNNFVVYPNPAHNRITVAFNATTSINSIVLYDLAGRIILEKTFSTTVGENKIVLDVSVVAKGVYLLRVGDGRKMVVID